MYVLSVELYVNSMDDQRQILVMSASIALYSARENIALSHGGVLSVDLYEYPTPPCTICIVPTGILYLV